MDQATPTNSPKIDAEIYVYATKNRFFNIFDALKIGKVHLQLTSYNAEARRQEGNAHYWLDINEARLLAHLISLTIFRRETGGRWQRFGGSTREDGIESRVLTVEWDTGEGDRFSKVPYRITIANGPGRKSETGSITPAGEPTQKVDLRVPALDMIEIMLALLDYIRAYEAFHYSDIAEARIRKQTEEMERRQNRTSNKR